MAPRSVPAIALVSTCCVALLGACSSTPAAPPTTSPQSIQAATSSAGGSTPSGATVGTGAGESAGSTASSGLEASPAAGSGAPPGGGDAWVVADVAEPSIVMTAPSLEPGYRCSPCHPTAASQLFGVGQGTDSVIAVGVQQPPAEAIALSSTDGRRWAAVQGFTGGSDTAAVAVASNGSRTVIVGHQPDGATTWASDGTTWQQAPRQASLLVPYGGGAMTSVTSLGAGFVAGGYRDDPLHAKASAAVWRSDDGLHWRLDDAGTPFAGGRIWGVASRGGVVVAVGTSGDPIYGPTGAWRWTATTGWRRAAVGPDSGGAMLAVTATPSGFVAVGQNAKDTGALAWTSTDGSAWIAVPDQPAFHYLSFPVRMQSVAVGPDGMVAGGWRSDAGNGSGITWTSTDGITWQQPTWVPSFSGGQIAGVTVAGGSSVAVGRTGYPDNNQATVWLGAAP